MIYLVDPEYNPDFKSDITSATTLAPGITLAKFLGSKGTRVQFEQLTGNKKQIARQLYLQAEAMRTVRSNPQFRNNRLIVIEGIYKPSAVETVTPNSINDYKQTGRAVVYQLINKEGKVDLENTFDLALYWKDYQKYQEMILDYDTFDPSGELSAQIVLVMPDVSTTWDIFFDKKLKTTFNGGDLSANEILEVLLTI